MLYLHTGNSLRIVAELPDDFISSDAPIGRTSGLLEQIREVIREGVLPMEQALALATRNPARVLALHDTGEIAEGKRADILLLDAHSLELRHVIAGGRVLA